MFHYPSDTFDRYNLKIVVEIKLKVKCEMSSIDQMQRTLKFKNENSKIIISKQVHKTRSREVSHEWGFLTSCHFGADTSRTHFLQQLRRRFPSLSVAT